MKFLTPKAIHFAPMEGITDTCYRRAVSKLYPEWDSYSTDFLRVPTVGKLKDVKYIEHLGPQIYSDDELKLKTVFQILTTEKAQTQNALVSLNRIKIKHLDLNLGCPSRKVNSHGGGAFLLQEVKALAKIIKSIRLNYPEFFSVKIRVGYRDDLLFNSLIKMFEDEGVNAITIHARTRDQLYKGIADWKYIKEAVKITSLPIIGNGDIWNLNDIQKIYNECDCFGVMIARGAMKTPWLAELFKSNNRYTEEELLMIRREKLPLYFEQLFKEYKNNNTEDIIILKRFKAFSRYLFDDFQDSTALKSKFLRTKELGLFFESLNTLP